MSCSCIKGTDSKFDFTLESLDCQTLVFTDLSSWMDDENYIIPEQHLITVVLPNSVERQINIKPRSNTVIKGEDLGVGKCIPDGIYCISIESCGIKYTRNASVTCQIECKIDELVKRLSKGEIDIERVTELRSDLEIIKSSIKIGQPKKAIDYHEILQTKLDNLNCECNCK